MKETVLRLVHDRARALEARDWRVVDAQLHPLFIYTNSQGERLTKAAYLEFLATGPLRWRRQWLEDASIVQVEDTAVLHGTVVDDLLINGEPHLLRFATTQTYVWLEDRCWYVAGHTAPIDDPGEESTPQEADS